MNWFNRAIHHGQIACKYAGALHAVAINLDQVHARRTNTQKLVERNLLLNVIRRRGREACGHFERTQGQAHAAFGYWTQRSEAHDARL